MRRQLARDYPPEVLGEDGLRIHSTLDVLAQLASESALRDHLNRIDGSGERLNGSVVVVAPSQGDVLALVSSRKPRDHGYNRALDAVRPIGSLVKPAVMLTALKQPKQYSLATPIPDEPISVPLPNGTTWTPQNFSGESHGPIPLLDVLVHSRNQATVQLGMEMGPGKVVRTLDQLGVQRKVPAYPSILLGSIGMTPFEVAMWYQPLATGGFATPLRSITDVLDKDGEPLARYPVETREVIDSGPAFLTQWAMQQVVNEGTGRGARKVLPPELRVAGKTGTSDEYRDAWFAGFSGNHLAVVWVGRDNNRNAQVTGATGALPVWSQLMSSLPQTSLPEAPPPAWKWCGWTRPATRPAARAAPAPAVIRCWKPRFRKRATVAARCARPARAWWTGSRACSSKPGSTPGEPLEFRADRLGAVGALQALHGEVTQGHVLVEVGEQRVQGGAGGGADDRYRLGRHLVGDHHAEALRHPLDQARHPLARLAGGHQVGGLAGALAGGDLRQFPDSWFMAWVAKPRAM